MTITVAKIGTGVEGDFFRADVPEGADWNRLEERDTEFVVEIKE